MDLSEFTTANSATVEALLLLQRPNDAHIRATIAAHRQAELTYAEIAATNQSLCPAGFASNESHAIIGHGEAAFQNAKAAIESYQMLNLGWVQQVGAIEPIATGSIVGTLARQLMVYSLNVAKIVSVDDSVPNRFGFSYGTTAEYPFIGEERFTVSLDEQTGEVSYEIYSFSRPKTFSMSLVLPLLRIAQRRFCHDSIAAMRAACGGQLFSLAATRHAPSTSELNA